MCFHQFSHLHLFVFALVLRCSYVGCINICNCYVFLLDWSLDHFVLSFFISWIFFILGYILSDLRIVTSTFFWFQFAWTIFFCPLTFSQYAFLGLNLISCVCVCVWHFCEWTLFCVHSANLCLLVEEFNQFSFKVIFDTGTFSLFWVCFCRSFLSLLFPAYRSHFNIYFKASLVMLNFLTFASL